MKKSILLLFLCFCAIFIQAQLYTVKKSSYNVIVPTLDNFRKLTSLTQTEFESCMRNYSYIFDQQTSDHKSSSYVNGGIGTWTEKCANTYTYNLLDEGKITYFCSEDNLYPTNCIKNLIQELKPYYYETSSNGADLFIIRNSKQEAEYIFAITYTTERSYYVIARKCLTEYTKKMFPPRR